MDIVLITILIILVVMMAMATAIVYLQKRVAAGVAAGSVNGGGGPTEIAWPPPRILKTETIDTALNLLKKRPGFGVMEVDEAMGVANELTKKYGASNTVVDAGQVMSLYRGVKAVAYSHAISRSKLSQDDIDAMLWNSVSVPEVANRLNLPLLVVLRRALALNGLSKNAIHSVLNSSKDPPVSLKDATAFSIKNDINSTPNTHVVQRHAEDFEREVEKRLTLLGVGFLTENDLRDERHTLTPDFLINSDEPLLINGKPINWIEVKNYPGVEIPGSFISKKIREQAAKYTKHFGPGAFVFNGGIAEDFDLRTPVMLLDFNF